MPPKTPLLLITALLLSSHPAFAERIYYKDGRVAKVPVAYRQKGVIWARFDSGSVGINRSQIDRIENDDGSISKYDYEGINRKTQEAISGKRYAEAVRMCSLFLETFPDDKDTRYLRAILSQKAGDLKMAADDYLYLINNDAATANAYNNLGTIYAGQGRDTNAIEMFLAAVKMNPSMIQAHHNLGVAYSKLGEREKARAAWNRVLEIEPDNFDAKKALEEIDAKPDKNT